VPLDERGAPIAVTVSIGVAVYPEHGDTAQEVMEAADEALYAAKRAGRDTYRLAGTGTGNTPVIKSAVSRNELDGNLDRTTAVASGPRPPRHRRGR